MSKERFYRELVLALPDKANADGWDDAAYFASKVKKLNESEELKRLGQDAYLLKDGSLEYKVMKSGREDLRTLQKIKHNYSWVSLLCAYIVARDNQDDECAILFFDIKKDSAKSISAFYTVFRLCNAHKVIF